MDSSTKAQALEVIDKARDEVQRDEPNMMRIRGFLSQLGVTIQTIGSFYSAHQALSAALRKGLVSNDEVLEEVKAVRRELEGKRAR